MKISLWKDELPIRLVNKWCKQMYRHDNWIRLPNEQGMSELDTSLNPIAHIDYEHGIVFFQKPDYFINQYDLASRINNTVITREHFGMNETKIGA